MKRVTQSRDVTIPTKGYRIEWRKEGAGFTGRWVHNDESERSEWDVLEVAPTAGLHPIWTWRNPFCNGKCSSAQAAMRYCEQTYFVCDAAYDAERRRIWQSDRGEKKIDSDGST